MNLTLALLDANRDAQHAFFSTGALAAGYIAVTAIFASFLGILYMLTLVVAPNLTQRFTGALRQRNIVSALVGLPVIGVSVFLVALLWHVTPVLGVAALAAGGVMLIMGWAVAAEDIGRRLYWACGKEGSRASHLASGWLVFTFASLSTPIGWFLIFPYVSLSGLGSIVVGPFSARKAAAAPEIEYKE